MSLYCKFLNENGEWPIGLCAFVYCEGNPKDARQEGARAGNAKFFDDIILWRNTPRKPEPENREERKCRTARRNCRADTELRRNPRNGMAEQVPNGIPGSLEPNRAIQGPIGTASRAASQLPASPQPSPSQLLETIEQPSKC